MLYEIPCYEYSKVNIVSKKIKVEKGLFKTNLCLCVSEAAKKVLLLLARPRGGGGGGAGEKEEGKGTRLNPGT